MCRDSTGCCLDKLFKRKLHSPISVISLTTFLQPCLLIPGRINGLRKSCTYLAVLILGLTSEKKIFLFQLSRIIVIRSTTLWWDVKGYHQCEKTAWKNSEYSRNETILKIDHFGKSIAHAKWAIWVTFFFQKHAENGSTRTIELFCAHNHLKKHRIFEKWDHFENRPFW